ncbi:AraC family transcriptional regulator [Spirosoma sp. BT702]|uniref:AraC family transcriptional regulator n=1 Tax=Spirosoma profusum TaxID=2771354 RepID=A0A927AVT9_9BACT|nr:helix-turn-helix domain-containing protein [Spirosoma profusum]MBD2705360.1 AraC family transcriptional regulator [Spirosoma profusum]
MIVFDFRPPSPALGEYVRQHQIVGVTFADTTTPPIKPYWPRPQNCLAFFPREAQHVHTPDGTGPGKTFRSDLIGQPTIVTNRHVGHDFVVFQVIFQPGALFRLTGIPANELANQFLDAETVFSSEIHSVNERLSSTDDPFEMVDIVEAFLHYLVRRQRKVNSRFDCLPIDKVSQFLLQNPTSFSLDWLADQANLSPRQFYNSFVQRMGISPKLYARIARFDQTMKLKSTQPHKDWLHIAIEMGYYDYQHMARDFKEFTTLTPIEFFQAETDAPERAFGNAETIQLLTASHSHLTR